MAVISATGEIYTPLVVLHGPKMKYRKWGMGKFETSGDYLARPNYFFIGSVAVVDTDIFLNCAFNLSRKHST